MYKEVFRRNEQKYLLSGRQKKRLMGLIGAEIEPDQYFEGTNCSLYFDAPDNRLIIKSIERPIFKQKVRLRSYGVPGAEGEAFLEAKVKYNGIVYKRRARVNLAKFWEYYDSLQDFRGEAEGIGDRGAEDAGEARSGLLAAIDDDSELTRQIARELDYLFRYYRLRPARVICYDRRSYVGRGEPELRITFDEKLRSRAEDLRLEEGDGGREYFRQATCVMEIKVLDAMPLWLVRALSALKIYPVSFTKYGKIYEQANSGG